jgi:hypothetical protein
MAAVAALERCLRTRDYAGAAQLVRQRKVADGLAILAAMARQSWAEQAYWRSVAEWRADHEATIRQRQERDVQALVALVAEVFAEEPDGMPVIRHPAPVSAGVAERNRSVLEKAIRQGRDAA